MRTGVKSLLLARHRREVKSSGCLVVLPKELEMLVEHMDLLCAKTLTGGIYNQYVVDPQAGRIVHLHLECINVIYSCI